MGPGQLRLLLLVLIAVQIGGFALLWTRLPEAGPAAIAAGDGILRPVIDPSTMIGAAKFPDEQMLRESVRAVLKQELGEFLQAQRPAGAPAVAGGGSQPGPARRPADPQVAQRSHGIVDRALAAGVWTDNDSAALLQIAPQLPEAQRVELLEKIFGAINRQELKPVGALPSL